jgi:hypothetical protein
MAIVRGRRFDKSREISKQESCTVVLGGTVVKRDWDCTREFTNCNVWKLWVLAVRRPTK